MYTAAVVTYNAWKFFYGKQKKDNLEGGCEMGALFWAEVAGIVDPVWYGVG